MTPSILILDLCDLQITPDVQVTKKLSEIRETLSTASGLKLKHLIILNDTREIDPVDISINLCELEL